MLQYTSLEPPPGPVWIDMDRRGAVLGPEQAPIEMEMDDKPEEDGGGVVVDERREKGGGGERGKADGKHKDCFAFGGGSSSSSSNAGSSSSESEVEQQERQRQLEQWNLKGAGSDRETLKKT